MGPPRRPSHRPRSARRSARKRPTRCSGGGRGALVSVDRVAPDLPAFHLTGAARAAGRASVVGVVATAVAGRRTAPAAGRLVLAEPRVGVRELVHRGDLLVDSAG